MKKIWFAVLLWMALGATARAAEAPRVSATFAEILTRVIDRDPDSGAIVSVRKKEDAPGNPDQA